MARYLSKQCDADCVQNTSDQFQVSETSTKLGALGPTMFRKSLGMSISMVSLTSLQRNWKRRKNCEGTWFHQYPNTLLHQ